MMDNAAIFYLFFFFWGGGKKKAHWRNSSNLKKSKSEHEIFFILKNAGERIACTKMTSTPLQSQTVPTEGRRAARNSKASSTKKSVLHCDEGEKKVGSTFVFPPAPRLLSLSITRPGIVLQYGHFYLTGENHYFFEEKHMY